MFENVYVNSSACFMQNKINKKLNDGVNTDATNWRLMSVGYSANLDLFPCSINDIKYIFI